jgi:DNA-binding transcriptional MerR regulator
MKYKISDLAKILGVTTNTIRRYENEGYITPERDASGYRWYTENDILKIAFIRLYRKCDFSHNSIEQMLDSNSSKITSICEHKLAEIDEQINTLKHLRHWLKDNIALMHTLENMDNGYVTMVCPPLKYVLYSIDDKLLTEKKRLKTINDFMYSVHEVQLMIVYKFSDMKNKIVIPHKGWAIKVMDIERLNLWNIVTDDNEFIETYPQQLCLYSVMKYPTEILNNLDKITQIRHDFFNRTDKYMNENGYKLAGDIMAIIVNNLGNTVDLLVCMPIEEKKSL